MLMTASFTRGKRINAEAAQLPDPECVAGITPATLSSLGTSSLKALLREKESQLEDWKKAYAGGIPPNRNARRKSLGIRVVREEPQQERGTSAGGDLRKYPTRTHQAPAQERPFKAGYHNSEREPRSSEATLSRKEEPRLGRLVRIPRSEINRLIQLGTTPARQNPTRATRVSSREKAPARDQAPA